MQICDYDWCISTPTPDYVIERLTKKLIKHQVNITTPAKIVKKKARQLSPSPLSLPTVSEYSTPSDWSPLSINSVVMADNTTVSAEQMTYDELFFDYIHSIKLQISLTILDNQKLDNQKEIGDNHFSLLIIWLLEIFSDSKLSWETIFLTFQIIVRYLRAVPNIKIDNFQLIGVCSMILASKIEDVLPFDIHDYNKCASPYFSTKDFAKCEQKIITAMEYQFHYPIVYNFVNFYMSRISSHLTREISRHIHVCALLSQFSVAILEYDASVVAYACVFLAFNRAKVEIPAQIVKECEQNADLVGLCVQYIEKLENDDVESPKKLEKLVKFKKAIENYMPCGV